MVEFLLISILFVLILIFLSIAPEFIEGCAAGCIVLVKGLVIGALIIVGIVLLALEETRPYAIGVPVLASLLWFISWSSDKHKR